MRFKLRARRTNLLQLGEEDHFVQQARHAGRLLDHRSRAAVRLWSRIMVRARDESSAAMPPRPAPKRSPCRPLDILVLVVGDGVAGELTHARPPWLRSSPMIERKGRP